MKKLYLVFLLQCAMQLTNAQHSKLTFCKDSVIVGNQVEFFIYDGPYGENENIKKAALRLVLSVKNKGQMPIPDLGVSNRSMFVNLFINDTINNPVSMYNGIEVQGVHLIRHNESDTYIWWFFEDEGYGNVFTVQWQYMNLLSRKFRVNVKEKTTTLI